MHGCMHVCVIVCVRAHACTLSLAPRTGRTSCCVCTSAKEHSGRYMASSTTHSPPTRAPIMLISGSCTISGGARKDSWRARKKQYWKHKLCLLVGAGRWRGLVVDHDIKSTDGGAREGASGSGGAAHVRGSVRGAVGECWLRARARACDNAGATAGCCTGLCRVCISMADFLHQLCFCLCGCTCVDVSVLWDWARRILYKQQN
jgi:hypothetical protein